jgi:hypothetical protein
MYDMNWLDDYCYGPESDPVDYDQIRAEVTAENYGYDDEEAEDE